MANENPANRAIGWNFDNSYSRLPEKLYSRVRPSPVRNPGWAVLNRRLAEDLGLDPEQLATEEGLTILAGNALPPGAVPLSQAYAGHQFGHFTMLGDGRAVLLGEQITPSGHRKDVQLKGAGRTPYSRGGDGRAVLGPMLREYIISEALHDLSIPTTRSLAVVTAGEVVYRDTPQPGAVLTRVAASHIRVGTFQYAVRLAPADVLRALADYTISRHYPEIPLESNERYLALLKAAIDRQARLIARWQLVGFVHGVMNTDNTALSGETIDYGPCAFMDVYDPATVFSSIDHYGRYAYTNQPRIGAWNMARFAETLLPLLADEPEQALKLAQEAIEGFMPLYQGYWLDGMRAKLGIFGEEDEDVALVDTLLSTMHQFEADFTNTFVALTFGAPYQAPLFASPEYEQWHVQWRARLSRQPESQDEIHTIMRAHNPALIPRNHRVEEALTAAEEHGDYAVMERLLKALSAPYAHDKQYAEYSQLPPPSFKRYKTFCGT